MGRTLRLAAVVALVAAVGIVAIVSAASGPGVVAQASGVRLVKVGDFEQPVFVTSPPGDRRRLYVVEQGGRIRVVVDGEVRRRPFLDIRRLVTAGGEQGLLSVAFPPDHARSKRFYVYYTDRDEQQRVVEYRAPRPERADPGSALLVLRMADPEGNHNGGQLVFGPDDRLYVGTGDGGGAGDQHGALGNAQDLGSLLGKLLRIDPRPTGSAPYGVPDDNPFAGRSGARAEVYAYGLRNPWRFSFDRRTGDLVVGDVGQGEVEEIDFAPRRAGAGPGAGAGVNFGWRVFEGRSRYATGERAPGHVPPVIELTHAEGNCSVTGGVVVRDPALPLAGRYVFADFCRGRLLSARLARPRARGVRSTGLQVPSPSSFGEDARGRVYVASLDGPVFRLAAR